MTALNLIVGRSASYLFSDYVETDPVRYDGIITGFRAKIVCSDRLKIAISISGLYGPEEENQLQAWLDAKRDQDAAMFGLPGYVKAAAERLAETGAHLDPARVMLFFAVAIWEEGTQRPQGGTHQGFMPPEMKPLKLHWIPSVVCPMVRCAERHMRPDFDPEVGSLEILEAQRREKNAGGHYFIGGGAELVIVDRDGVRVQVLKHWPDLIGERISPDPIPKRRWTDHLAPAWLAAT